MSRYRTRLRPLSTPLETVRLEGRSGELMRHDAVSAFPRRKLEQRQREVARAMDAVLGG